MKSLEARIDPRKPSGGMHRSTGADGLGASRCLDWEGDGYTGAVRLGRVQGQVQRVLPDRLEIRIDEVRREEPGHVLRSFQGLPGNSRWAREPSGEMLLRADVAVHPQDSERTTVALREARHVLSRLLGERSVRHARQDLDPERVAEAVAQLGWEEDRIVQFDQPGCWELRPRLLGHVVPVLLRSEEQDLCLAHRVLRQVPGGERGRAIEDHALRQNLRVRGCRLARDADGGLVVETYLDARLVDGTQLATHIRAVAAATRHVRGTLRLLAEQAPLARSYVRLYCT